MRNNKKLTKFITESTEKTLFELISVIPGVANIKDASNGKYTAVSKSELEMFKFKDVDDMIGLTVKDLDDRMKQCWGSDFAERILVMDNKIKNTGNLAVDKNRVFIDKNGFVRFRDIYKSPLFGKCKHKISSILTLSFDYTDEIDLITLFNKYLELHNNKKKAIICFKEYLKINVFFYEPLTAKELMCLLYARVCQTRKDIATQLNIAVKTVDAHIENISNKLKMGTVKDLVDFLRKMTDEYKEDYFDRMPS